MVSHAPHRVSAVLCLLAPLLVLFGMLNLTASRGEAQTGGRVISRTHQSDEDASSQLSFHGGDAPAAGATGGVGGWDPSQPPTQGTWYYAGNGNMYHVNGSITWYYGNWTGTNGEIWYHNGSGWHFWGRWDKVSTFALNGDGPQEQSNAGTLVVAPPPCVATRMSAPLAA